MKSYLQSKLKKMLDGIFKIDAGGNRNSINWDGTVTLKSLELDPGMFANFNVTPC